MPDLLSKFAKRKVTVPSNPRLQCRGDYNARGVAGSMVVTSHETVQTKSNWLHTPCRR